MVTITQEGNLSAPQSNGLFQDVKFWFSLTVPSRNTLMSDVRANGGKITHAEIDADFCIIDHARPPNPNSVNHDKPMHSYRYITESIREGLRENANAYRVDLTRIPQKKTTATAIVRATTSKPNQMIAGGRSKRGRNPFSKEDDLILMRAISKPGAKTYGNKVYQEIASEHPSHSFHGWRGRWVDHYSKLNPDPHYWYKKLKKSAGIDEEDEDAVVVRSEPRRILPKQNSPKSSSHRRTDEFTNQDDRILEKYHKTVQKAADPLEVWEQLEERYPHHRASHWRKRYSGVVLPRLKDKALSRRSSGTTLATTPPIHVLQQQTPIKGEASQQYLSSAAKLKTSPKSIPSAIKPKELSSIPRPQPTSGLSSPTPKLTAESLPPNKSKQSTQEYVSRWRVQVGPKHTGVATPSGNCSSRDNLSVLARPTTPQANKKRKRIITPSSHGLSRDAEIPSTPEHSRPTKLQRRREPSPELGSSLPPLIGFDGVDPDLVIPPLPSMDAEEDPPLLPAPVPNEDNTPRKKRTIISRSSPPSPLLRSEPKEDPDLTIPPLDTGLDPSTTSSRESTPDPDVAHNFFFTLAKKYPGLTEEKVVWALHRTGGDVELTEAVLVANLSGEGLLDLPGVWSEKEDEILRGNDSRALEELMMRKDDYEARWNFLEEWEMNSPSRKKSGSTALSQ